jgi:hypothetical protein
MTYRVILDFKIPKLMECSDSRRISKMGIMRVRLNLGDTVYVSDEEDHGIIEQFVPYGRLIVRLVRKGKVLKLSRGDVKKSRQ